MAKTAIVTENELFWHFGHILRRVSMKKEILWWLMSIIPVVSNKVMAGKPIDSQFGMCICCHGGSKLTKTVVVTKNELLLHFGHI